MSTTTLSRDEFRKFAKGDYVEKEVASGTALAAIKGEDMDKYSSGAVMAYDEFKTKTPTVRKIDIPHNNNSGHDTTPPSRL